MVRIMGEMPHNEAFEKALLAQIIRNNALADSVAHLLPSDFHNPVNGAVFETMRDLRQASRPINIATLGGLVGSDPLGGASVIDSLRAVQFGEDTPAASDIANALLDLSLRRAMMAQGEWLAQQAGTLRTAPAEMLSAHRTEIDALTARSSAERKTMFTFADAMSEALERFQAPGDSDRIPTGITDLDKATAGFGRGELNILAGRPSMGKTALAINWGTAAALSGHGVLIFSLEMSKEAWLARVASEATWSNGAGIPYNRAIKKQLDGYELERFVTAGLRRAGLPCVIEERADLTAAEIAARTRQVARDLARTGKRLGLVVVDHIGKVKPSKAYKGNRVNELGEITNALANLAKSEDAAVLALSQINRQVEGRDNKRPQLSDLRESGNIEQDADAVFFVYRAAYYLERSKEDNPAEEEGRKAALAATRHILEIAIAKARNDELTTIDLFCDMGCNVIRNLDQRYA
jgi:replicative DNA helicase